MSLSKHVQSTVIEHRETRDDAGACVGCSCGLAWPVDEALLAYGRHMASVLVDGLAAPLIEPVPESVMWAAALERFNEMTPGRTRQHLQSGEGKGPS